MKYHLNQKLYLLAGGFLDLLTVLLSFYWVIGVIDKEDVDNFVAQSK